jgi:hypothetical protein
MVFLLGRKYFYSRTELRRERHTKDVEGTGFTTDCELAERMQKKGKK